MCHFEGARYLFFSSNVPHLVYYSHLPIVIIAFLMGIFVFWQGKKELPNQILLLITSVFSFWTFLDSVFWASNRSDVIMFVWSLQILVEPLVHAGCLYLIYVLVNKKDAPFFTKVIAGLLYLPLIIFVPTAYSLSGFDLTACLSTEGPVALYYTYSIEIIFTLWIIVFCVRKYKTITEKEKRKEILSLASGILLLLFAFSFGNIISSFSENWNYAQIGLFAMPVFIGLLAYSIVKFKTFNIKLLAAQALVIGMVILIGSEFFFITNPINRILTAITLVLVTIFGLWLAKSVKTEVEQKEQLEVFNRQLADSNEKLKELDKAKSEFLSIASHQLRTPLAGIKGYLSMVLDGDFGPVPEKIKPIVAGVFDSSNRMTRLVSTFLNVSRIESGRFQLDKIKFSLVELVQDAAKELMSAAANKDLALTVKIPHTAVPDVFADKDKIKDVLLNLIDNAIKYTPKGSITVVLEQTALGQLRVTVRDTGVGIDPHEAGKLFAKFVRGEGIASVDTTGSGLGLFIAKKIVEAHGGRIWDESDGKNKGSRFIFELPIA